MNNALSIAETTRTIERELFIDASPDIVFRAFTEADHIMGWFAPYAHAEPGPGGYINLCWIPDSKTKDCEILEWEPGKHLLMAWYAGPGGDTNLPVDLRLEAKDGGTLLRLVHSGFLSDESWDDEFDSHGRGWSYELRSLKYYVEQQLGQARAFITERIPAPADLGQAWDTLIGNAGVFGADRANLREGDRFTLRLPSGEETQARVMFQLADNDFVAFADVLNGGLFRFAYETFTGQPELWVWAFSWHLAEQQLEELVGPWFDEVRQRLEDG